MIKIEKTDVFGWESAIRGMRNPMNSWKLSDSAYEDPDCEDCPCLDEREFQTGVCKNSTGRCYTSYCVGDNDLKLAKNLVNAGTDHRKFMRMIVVYADITAPLYWWKEFDTYKVGTVANSCSTMHKIHAKEFTLDDFSCEHLMTAHSDSFPLSGIYKGVVTSPLGILDTNIAVLNLCREKFLKTKDKQYWWQMIQLLPTSYNQKRTVMLNYEVLSNIYKSRKNHKLDEWRELCKWIESLHYSELITGEKNDE